MSPDDVSLGNATLAMSICSSSLGNALAAEEGERLHPHGLAFPWIYIHNVSWQDTSLGQSKTGQGRSRGRNVVRDRGRSQVASRGRNLGRSRGRSHTAAQRRCRCSPTLGSHHCCSFLANVKFSAKSSQLVSSAHLLRHVFRLSGKLCYVRTYVRRILHRRATYVYFKCLAGGKKPRFNTCVRTYVIQSESGSGASKSSTASMLDSLISVQQSSSDSSVAIISHGP